MLEPAIEPRNGLEISRHVIPPQPYGSLVFTRYRHESIMVGESEVMIVSVDGGKVKVRVRAPRSVAVHRREVYDQIANEKAAAEAAEVAITLIPSSQLDGLAEKTQHLCAIHKMPSECWPEGRGTA